MKIRSTSLAMAAMMSAGFLAAPINVLAKAPEMPQGIYAQPFSEGEKVAAKEKHYELECELKKADGSGKPSMAAGAIKKAVAVEKDGKWTFTITTQKINVMKLTGWIDKLYYYKDGAKESSEAAKKGDDWSFTLDTQPEKSIKLAFKIGGITAMKDAKPDALLVISEYKEIKDESSQESGKDEPNTPGTTPEDPGTTDPSKPNTGDTPEQQPKEEAGLEKAKKTLDAAIQKAKSTERATWENNVNYALNNALNYGEAYLAEPTAKEQELLLREAQINYLLALGEKSKGIKMENLQEGQISEADYRVLSDFGDIEQYIEKKEITKDRDWFYCIVTFKPVVKGSKTTYVEDFESRNDGNPLETMTVGDKVYPKKIKVASNDVRLITIDGVKGKVSFSGREGQLFSNGKKALDYERVWKNCQAWTTMDKEYLQPEEMKSWRDALNDGSRLLQSEGLTQAVLNEFNDKTEPLIYNFRKATAEEVDNLRKHIEQIKQRDLSMFTEKSKKEFNTLLEKTLTEVNGKELSRNRVFELHRLIGDWHGELKAPERPKDGNETKPKDENKDKPKDENPLDKKDEKKKDQTLRYELPVALTKVGGGKSMASSALSSSATVDVYNGRYTYYVQFRPMKMKGMEGHLTNLFYYDGGKRRASYHGDGLWSFTLNDKVQSQKIALWVDVMDEMQGGPGKGEQDAYLQFDWNSARETRRIDGEVKTPEKQTEEKKTEDKKKEEQKSAEEKKKEVLKAKSERERNAVLTQFKDIGADHWALNAIAHSVARGYFKGEGEGRFAPNRAITRAEFVTILGRKAGITPTGASTAFGDVKADAYYAPYVAWAESKGIVKGTGFGKFEPNRTITREEMAVILDKFLADQNKTYSSTNKGQFNDGLKVSSWAKESVEKMTNQGLLSGVGNGNFVPKGSFTRAQAAQVLYTIDTKDMK